MSNTSKCSFCGSTSWGKNCKYSPYKQTHFHGDAKNKCVWCGSTQMYGKGCKYSPSGYHGASSNAYTQMVGESLPLGRLIKTLSTPFIETNAYKLGLINENGELIKKPITQEEKQAYTLLDRYVFKVKSLLGNKLDLINHSTFLESVLIEEDISDLDKYKSELELKNELEVIAKRLNEAVEKALTSGIALNTIEKTILEKFSK